MLQISKNTALKIEEINSIRVFKLNDLYKLCFFLTKGAPINSDVLNEFDCSELIKQAAFSKICEGLYINSLNISCYKILTTKQENKVIIIFEMHVGAPVRSDVFESSQEAMKCIGEL